MVVVKIGPLKDVEEQIDDYEADSYNDTPSRLEKLRAWANCHLILCDPFRKSCEGDSEHRFMNPVNIVVLSHKLLEFPTTSRN